MTEPATASPSLPLRGLLLGGLALALVGAGLSAELTRIHVLTHTDPGYTAICAVNERFDCNLVAWSPSSVLAGLPIAVWGLFGYLLMAALSGWGLARRAAGGWPAGLLFASFLLAALASSVLGTISLVKIGSTCLFCAGTYLVNALLLALGVAMLRRLRRGPRAALAADLRQLAGRPRTTAALVVLAVGAVVVTELAVPAYWRHRSWRELPELPQGIDRGGHHWIGAARPLVTITEFSDYECPYCRQQHRALRELLGDYRDTVRLVHRHYPLDPACNPAESMAVHPSACRLAWAVECAGDQGRFWEMNDAVFGAQDSTPAARVDVERLAVELGLDRGPFAACLASAGPGARIRADAVAGGALQLPGTPTFYVGTRSFPGRMPPEALRQLVEAARAGSPAAAPAP